MNPEPVRHTVDGGLQRLPAQPAASPAAVVLACRILREALTVSESIEAIAAHFSVLDRADAVIAALTTFSPEDERGWVHLGQRAWLREWLREGTRIRVVPAEGAGPEDVMTMPWLSQQARLDVAVVPDTELLPPEAAQDRRELAGRHARGLLAAAQLLDGTMYGSLSVVSESAGPWPETVVSDLRLLNAALASRMSAEQARRAAAEAMHLADQARAAQQQFFATIGHELRTPIAAILGFAEVLGDEAREQGPDASRFVQEVARDSGVILRASEQLLSIVEDLLSTGRTLGAEEDRGEIDVAAAVADVIHWHRTPALAGRVSVTSVIEPGVSVYARPSGLRQVLTNLVGNAISHNRPGGAVEISAQESFGESREPRLRIVVRDTGRGLAPAELARVFDPFVRFAAPGVKGTGLGLSLARAVAERDGGVIGAESTSGVGSTFWVDLPATSV